MPRCPPAFHSGLLGADSGCCVGSVSSDFQPPPRCPIACDEGFLNAGLIDELNCYLSPLKSIQTRLKSILQSTLPPDSCTL